MSPSHVCGKSQHFTLLHWVTLTVFGEQFNLPHYMIQFFSLVNNHVITAGVQCCFMLLKMGYLIVITLLHQHSPSPLVWNRKIIHYARVTSPAFFNNSKEYTHTHTQITEQIILHTISISCVICGTDSCKCNAGIDTQVTVMYNLQEIHLVQGLRKYRATFTS